MSYQTRPVMPKQTPVRRRDADPNRRVVGAGMAPNPAKIGAGWLIGVGVAPFVLDDVVMRPPSQR